MPPRKKTKNNAGKAASVAPDNNASAAAASGGTKRKQPASSNKSVAQAAPKGTRSTKAQKAHQKPAKDPPAQKDSKIASKAGSSKAAAATKVTKSATAAKAAKPAKTAATTKAAPASKAATKAKPAAVAKKTKKRNPPRPIYDEVWKEVYLAGTEWDQLKLVYSVDWDFDHLDEALTEGDLVDKTVYLFGATEPQLLMRDEKDEKGDVIPVPVIVAVVIDVPPPSTVGLKSVQRTREEIVPMANLRMGWHPYAPDNVAHSRRFQRNVHILKCNERKARLRNMVDAEVHQYDYVLPYFFKPDQVEDATEDTVVQVLAELDGLKAPLICEFDYELDDFKEFVQETIKDNELDADKHTEALKTAIRDAVKATKLKYKAEKEERKKRINAISPEEREAIKSMKLLKFYPLNEWPDVSKIKSPFVNRYYGRATEVL